MLFFYNKASGVSLKPSSSNKPKGTMNRYSMSEFDSSSVIDSETGERIPLHRALVEIVHLRKLLFGAIVDGKRFLFQPEGETDIDPDELVGRRVAIVDQPCPDEPGAICQMVVALETLYAEERIVACTPVNLPAGTE